MSLRWASRGDGLCRQFQLPTPWTSVHNLPNSYDEVRTKDISFLLFQSLQLSNMNILFSCEVTNEVVLFFLSLQKYSWMTSCWHTQSSWPQTSSSRSCFSSILSSRQNHKCQPLQFWNSSKPIIRWFIYQTRTWIWIIIFGSMLLLASYFYGGRARIMVSSIILVSISIRKNG